ncbi:hypothetical protein [Leuconostoc citreum]|uniref:hypothetical protein n=1 Tax=Leuconostoc citreum TaxID=33964 RepID=UPI00186B7212|nr:hypothetical protein [Leuconostoc citreum]MBE4726245.1 hypothetical protein [Leuconostoc citreum]
MNIDLKLVKQLNKCRTLLSWAFLIFFVSIIFACIIKEEPNLKPILYYLICCEALWNLFIYLSWWENAKVLLDVIFKTLNNDSTKSAEEYNKLVDGIMDYREQVYKIRLLIVLFNVLFVLLHIFCFLNIYYGLKILIAIFSLTNGVSLISFFIKSDNYFDSMILKYGDEKTKKIVNI